jgi:hypothetical protein
VIPYDPPDTCTRTGAERLAARIALFWRQQGHEVETRVVMVSAGKKHGAIVFGVRSNMVGGLPASMPRGELK